MAALCWLLLAACGLGQQVPPPADGILDETRALSESSHRQLAEELRLFRQDLKCDAWVTASSFSPTDMTIRRKTQVTRQAWSGDRPAVLMAYDRATNSSGLSFSPALWERYPSTELFETMHEARRILSDTSLTLDERFVLATRSWIDRLRGLEAVRLRQSLLIQKTEKRFALVSAGVLAALALVAGVLGLLSRRRDVRAERRFHFPDIQVGLRFGAPYGGGVTAEISAQAGTS